ncbi:MAG: DNA cytosine methyltransferase [Bacteriovoracaceae bacterium]|nr:DNA cytosine methyltransferase [Bacteriovoracaceae bacterium]
MKKNNSLMKVISLYTGAGGLDYGLEAAGFETAVAIEMDKWCCKTLRHNRSWPVIESKVEEVTSKTILETAGLKKGEAGLLVGGPPCQPFSKAGYWMNGDAKRLNDPRSNTLGEYMRVLEDTLPHAFILENVFGLAYKGKDEGLVFLKTRLEEINKKNKVKYTFNWKVINTAEFGVPQIRERVFIVGSRDGIEFNFPEPRFRNPDDGLDLPLMSSQKQLEPFRTAWDAIGDLVDPNENPKKSQVGGKWGALLPSIPPGENYLYHTERGGGQPLFKWRSRYWSFLLKLHPEKPSWTIQAQPGTAIGPFHWNNRRLTMREMARIQTFPDDVEILGGNSNIQKQLGNAVPSAVGELLGKEIKKQVFGMKVNSLQLSLVPNKNLKLLKINFIKTLPSEYREMLQG